MKTATLERMSFSDQGTFSRIFGPGGFQCAAIELPWRGNRQSLSCIPPGEYIVEPWESRRFGSVYHVLDVPNRSYILFHGGNLAGDTLKGFKTHSHGCILLGRYHGALYVSGKKQKAVLASRPTVRAFRQNIGRENFKLIIK